MNICNKLYAMKKDEAGGILAYNKLKNEMPPEHKEHIDTIEMIIGDEYDHLQDIENIMKEMKCPELTAIEEIYIVAKEIYDRTNEIEKICKTIQDKKVAEDIHKMAEDIEKMAEDIEKMTREIDRIAKS